MKKIQDNAALAFIGCVGILTIVSILGVWSVLTDDVITKSFQTISLLAVVTILIMVVAPFLDAKREGESTQEIVVNPIFTSIRYITVSLLIAGLVLLTLTGVLAIWDVLSEDGVVKALSSIAILLFCAFIMVITAMERENHSWLRNAGDKKISVIRVIFLIIAVLLLAPMFLGMLTGKLFY